MRRNEPVVANDTIERHAKKTEQHTAEFGSANNELAYGHEEKEERSAALVIANHKLAFQNAEKEKRVTELVIANAELAFQSKEKGRRAAELIIANRQIIIQNAKKAKRAAELLIANTKLHLQNKQKEKRAVELVVANKELLHQNREKEKRADELAIANKILAAQKIQLEDFCNIISHNLRGPLVNISILVDFITKSKDAEEQNMLSEKLHTTTDMLNEIFNELIESLQIRKDTEVTSEKLNLRDYVEKACDGLRGQIRSSQAIIEVTSDCVPFIDYPPKYLLSLLYNLISNSLKYAIPGEKPVIKIETRAIGDNTVLSIADNGLGIDLVKHKSNLFKIRKVS